MVRTLQPGCSKIRQWRKEQSLGVADLYKNSDLFRITFIWWNKALIKELSVPAPGTKQPFITKLMACLWKQSWSYWWNPLYTAVHFLFTVIIALMFGTMFWKLGNKT
ncbi:hypothetical protein MLD38_004912 [Melastoma candidum]|uniref:Uncharacterized protein n=1 Tax=Melastoma candidum TaxID=119954 RepID=A0ACB9SC45_9MYRT|nr:hypothetical protein MLD38_004912 [Melastoma candidum]